MRVWTAANDLTLEYRKCCAIVEVNSQRSHCTLSGNACKIGRNRERILRHVAYCSHHVKIVEVFGVIVFPSLNYNI